MKHLTVGVALVLTLATAGCGGDDTESDTAAPAESSTASEAPSESPAPATGADAENVLTGTVGTEADPDAFEISLTDSSGKAVESLPAGEYTIQVNDLSKIHNFHLKGGEVDESTTVPETGEKTFTVDLTAGDYEAVCDPHPKMVTSFTVT